MEWYQQLVIVVLASLNARAGDIVRPKTFEAYVRQPFLTYSDIELVVTGNNAASVRGRIKMRNSEGEKYFSPLLYYQSNC